MRKRLAKKALSNDYFEIWEHHDYEDGVVMPRNSKCWGMIQRACLYYKRADVLEEFRNNILKFVD